MKLLTINTSGKISEVGLVAGNCSKSDILEGNKPQSETLLIRVDNLLNEANLTVKMLDFIGVVTGPGSFTGLRIALSIAKAFVCVNKSMKAIAVNSFELMSYIIGRKDKYIMCLSSGNIEPYYAIYDNGIVEMSYKSIDNLKQLSKETGMKIYNYSHEEIDSDFIKIDYKEQALNNLVLAKINNKEFKSGQEINPVYIKDSQAEKELRQLVKEHFEIKSVIMTSDLVEIENECFDKDRWSLTSFEEELANKDRKYFMAYYKGKPIGYIGLWKTDGDLNLLKLAVVKEFRKLGIASHLLEKAIEYKNNNGLNEFFLEVNVNNDAAIKLYKKFGFKTVHERKRYYENGDGCLVMFYQK